MPPFLPTRRALLGAGLGLKIRPAPPNIILIVTDDQRWDALSCYEKPGTLGFLRTPNMDRLAAEGVRFRNAFVTTSLCSPSRASVLTGQYASTHGVESLEGDLAPGAVTFPALLRRAGYETAYIGKYHLGKDSDRPRPEYNHWAVFRGQGDYSNPTINVNGISSQATGYVTDVLTDQAIEFVTRRRARPFFLQLGHKAPHSPVVPPKHLERLYDGLTVPLPATYGEGHADKPGWFLEQHDHDYFHVLLHPREKYEQYVKDYCRTIASVDENLGRLLKALDDARLAENTAVIHMSDNGHFLAEHQLYSKMLMYEESIRIPLIVRYPAAPRGRARRGEMVLNIDLAPTILDLAGVPPSGTFQGRSFAPLIRGNGAAGWRKSWRYEYNAKAGWGLPSLEGVRTADGWKYVRFPDWEQLYNLKEDPRETENLAARPQHRRKKAQLLAELKRLGGGGPLAPPRPYKRRSEPAHTPHGGQAAIDAIRQNSTDFVLI